MQAQSAANASSPERNILVEGYHDDEEDGVISHRGAQERPDVARSYESDSRGAGEIYAHGARSRSARRRPGLDTDSESARGDGGQTRPAGRSAAAQPAPLQKRAPRRERSQGGGGDGGQASDGSSPRARKPPGRPKRKTAAKNHHTTIEEAPDEDMASSEAIVTDPDASDPDADRFEIEKTRGRKARALADGAWTAENNPYNAAIAKLQLSAIPDRLPCRDSERQSIVDYIKNGLKNKGSSSSLYISGMPGTGKTATTMEVIRDLKRKYRFSFLAINAMQLTNPNLVYTIIYEKITGKKMAPANAALFLDEFFKKRDKQKILDNAINHGTGAKKSKASQQDLKKRAEMMRVLLIDELDALMTKKQTLLYNLFDWPCHQNSRLLVISIANTMDLPERMQQKISSRIGNNRLVYEPYTLKQIQIILTERLHDIQAIIDQKGLDFIARKVSMYSGDIRRSLQITKRAVELAREEWEAKVDVEKSDTALIPVTFRHAVAAFNDLFNSKTVQVLKALTFNETFVILALHLELKAQGAERVLLDKVHRKCSYLFI